MRGRPRLRASIAPRPLAALALAAVLAVALGGGSASRAAFAPTPPNAQTDDSVPANSVMMIGASAEEAGAPGADETWGIGAEGGSQEDTVLVRYTAQQGWVRGPALPEGFKLASDPLLAARITPHGTGAMLGTIGKRNVVLTRAPGGAFVRSAPVTVEGEEAEGGGASPSPLLTQEEALFTSSRAPLLAALDEPGGGAGALVVPVSSGKAEVERQVLHWSGGSWSSEPIEIPTASASSFRVLALEAASPQNAWLLGQLASGAGYPEGAVALFRRVEEGGSWVWKPVALAPGGGDGEAHPLYVPVAGGEQVPFEIHGSGAPPTVEGQVLTVTDEGVWIDGDRGDLAGTGASTTLYFKAQGSDGGTLQASWCLPPPSTPSACTYELPQALPRTAMRSLAWAGGGPYG